MELWQDLGHRYPSWLKSFQESFWSAVPISRSLSRCLQSLGSILAIAIGSIWLFCCNRYSVLGSSHLYLHRKIGMYYQCARMRTLWHICSSLRACVLCRVCRTYVDGQTPNFRATVGLAQARPNYSSECKTLWGRAWVSMWANRYVFFQRGRNVFCL